MPAPHACVLTDVNVPLSYTYAGCLQLSSLHVHESVSEEAALHGYKDVVSSLPAILEVRVSRAVT